MIYHSFKSFLSSIKLRLEKFSYYNSSTCTLDLSRITTFILRAPFSVISRYHILNSWFLNLYRALLLCFPNTLLLKLLLFFFINYNLYSFILARRTTASIPHPTPNPGYNSLPSQTVLAYFPNVL